MASIEDILDAVKATLEANLDGVTAYAQMPGQVNVPAVLAQPVSADFAVAMGRGSDTWQIDLVMLVALADEQLTQRKLLPYLDGGGSSSIRKVVFNNRTLGLADVDAHIASMGGYNGRWEVAGHSYGGASLRLIVTHKPD